ncbi:MAG: TonB-dependent receptor plug domain-containing protein [Gammaproteobacteria bacterium]|nr:TonB-dependent receptor plug domain-containing protein [Gammaproteobacteria bacterium]
MKKNRAWTCRAGLFGMVWVVCGLLAGTAAAEETQEDEEEAATEVVIVTGTRLDGGDPTARVLVITAEDIKAQGASTFEDVIRSIPQNFSTINSSNSLLFGSDLLDANLGALGLGAATANLRGFGSKHTLVLVNGKRLAGIASQAEQLAANLNDIPTAAIERVEVAYDGGSAVYGSDAVAGVINVITKRDYRGLELSARLENSSTGGHGRSTSVFAGTGWDSGNVSAIVSLRQSDPIDTAKTGWTSNDYSDRYGGNQDYNLVGTAYARSGTVALSRWGPASLILPPGNDGRNAQPGDFVAPGPGDYLDVIPADIGGSVDNQSVTLSLLQEFGGSDELQLRADVLWSETETASRVSTFGFSSILVPASNAFNNFGHDVYVGYYADTEVELGLVPDVEQTNVQQQFRYVVSATYEFSESLRAELDFSRSESSSEGDQYMFAPPSTRVDDDARYERLIALIASSDPGQALNLFGDGTGQNPTIAEFYRSFANDHDETHTRSFEPKLSGEFWELPGGKVGFVVGTELRKEWIETPGDDFTADYIGTPRPTRELTAYFLEGTVPVVGDGNSRPLLERLVFSLQVRNDDYSASGSVENDESDEPIIIDARFSNTVVRTAALWKPSAEWDVRVARSEAFKTPGITQVFGGTTRTRQSNFVYDPLRDPPWVSAIQTFGPNTELSPESSVNWTVGVEWLPEAVEGLQVKAAWSRIDLEDRIASSSQLSGLLPVEVYGNLPQFFVRDEMGNLLESITRPVNIARRADERLDLEVSYRFQTDFGTVRPRLVYHRVLDMFDEAVPGGGEFRFYGESVGVDKYKVSANVSLVSGRITGDLWIRHTPSYINNDYENNLFRQFPNERVDSRTTVDLTTAYQVDDNLRFRFGGRNILNEGFPFMLSSSRRPYDSQRVGLRKRVLFLEMEYSLGMGQ